MDKRQNKDKRSKNSQTFRALANFSQVGFTMAASVLVGVFLGKFLDGWLGTSPWLLLVFSLLGVGAAIRSLFNWPKENDR